MAKPVGSHITLLQIDTLHCQRKELEQRRTKVAPWWLLWLAKKHKAMSNSEEIKPISLSIVELYVSLRHQSVI